MIGKFKAFIRCFLVVATVLSMSAIETYAQSNNNYVSDVRSFNKTLNGLIISGNFDVDIKYGNEPNVNIFAKENIRDLIDVRVLNKGYVVIEYKNKSGKSKSNSKRNRPLVEVVTNNLEYLCVSGSCDVVANGNFESQSDLKIEVYGVSSLKGLNVISDKNSDIKVSGCSNISNSTMGATNGRLKISVYGSSSLDMNVDCNVLISEIFGASNVKLKAMSVNSLVNVLGKSQLKMNIDCDMLNAEVAGSSRLILSGASQFSAIKLSGASMVDMLDMEVEYQKAKLSGASVVKSMVNNHAQVDCNSSSAFQYTGTGVVENSSRNHVCGILRR